MDATDRQALRAFVLQCLHEAGDSGELGDGDSLFVSGRLDSLALTRLVLFLEERFGVDFSRLDFSAELVDSIGLISALLEPQPAARS